MPLGLSAFAFRVTQSVASGNRIIERLQPCRTPDSTGNHSEKFPSTITLQLRLLVEHPHKCDHLWRNSKGSQDLPQGVTVQAVIGFPEFDEVDEQRGVRLDALLNQSSYLRGLRAKI